MTSVPRIGRMLDVVGLVLFLGGTAVAAWAWLGFQGLPEYQPPADAPAWSAVEVANGYWRLQNQGHICRDEVGNFLASQKSTHTKTGRVW